MRYDLVSHCVPLADYEIEDSLPLVGKLSFFVFHIIVDYEISDYLVGLHVCPVSDGYLVSGTGHDFTSTAACYDYNQPYHITQFYEYVRQVLKDHDHNQRV